MEKPLSPLFKLIDLIKYTIVFLHILISVALMVYFVVGNHHLLQFSIPSTKEVRFLPNPNKGIPWCNYLLGFEPKENKYKVVLTKHHAQEGYLKYWIFNLGIDKSWRETQSIFSCVLSGSPVFALVELSISSSTSLITVINLLLLHLMLNVKIMKLLHCGKHFGCGRTVIDYDYEIN